MTEQEATAAATRILEQLIHYPSTSRVGHPLKYGKADLTFLACELIKIERQGIEIARRITRAVFDEGKTEV